MSLKLHASTVDTTSDPAKYELWKPKIAAYRKKLADSLVKEWLIPESELPADLDATPVKATEFPYKYLSKEEIAITDTSATALTKKLASGELSAVDTLNAFVKRALIAHQLTNCFMEFFYEDALAEATKLDAILKETGKPVGPLHGLPMSVKEHFNFKDHVTHAGYVGWLDRVSPEFADTTKQLIDCGAVIFCRTTEPQSLMHLDSYNNIVGRCRNPNNTFLSPGGSSSGEGAMVAMGGSALGMGSDGGGSIRAPSAFCGIYGLKATAQRISIKGFTVSVAGIEGFIGVIGPMTRFVEDLDLFMTAILNFANPWKYDPFLTVVPWRPVEDPKPTSLKIGVVFDDGIVRPHANIKRALETVVGKLKEQGVEIVSFKPPRHEEAMRAIMKVYSGDGNECQKDALAISGEPINPLTTWTLSFGDGDEGMPVRDLYRTSVTKGEVRQEYLDMMNNESIDFILSPTYVGCAPVPDTLHYWGYTCIYNLLDMPNVVFPTGLYSDSTLDKPENFKPRNEYEEYEHKLFEDPAIFDGAPLNLQLTGKRFSDEKLVKAVKVISEIIKT